MRNLLVLSVSLALFLTVVVNVQRMVALAMTNRPFLGVWSQDMMSVPGARPARLEFQRGGNLGINRFGEPGRVAHWEEGARDREIVVTGLDAARPNERESIHWTVSRNRLLFFPMALSGGRAMPPWPYNLFGGYNRAHGQDWPAPAPLVGRWVTFLGRPVRGRRTVPPRSFVRTCPLRPFSGSAGVQAASPPDSPYLGRRMLLDLQPHGVLQLYEDGHPQRRGLWTADEAGHTFTLTVDPDRSASGRETWTGQFLLGSGDYSEISLSAPRKNHLAGMAGLYQSDHVGIFTRVPESPAGRQPFLGVWRINRRFPGRHFQMELRPGGELRVTEADGSSRRGTWEEAAPWPRLTLTGLDPEHPESARSWFWSHQNAHRSLVYGVRQRESYKEIPELLRLFDASPAVTDLTRGTFFVLERVPQAPSDAGPRPK